MNIAAMAQVLRAQRVWSIHVENDTSLLGNTYNIEISNKFHTLYSFSHIKDFPDKMDLVISGLALPYRDPELLLTSNW